ncbi:protein of unknown function [Magnetospirillum sp. XM-1]|nr:protein of unknown function [Magnetospirillum sp. XM-1]
MIQKQTSVIQWRMLGSLYLT